ncbi:MAG: DUF488 family protein [Candidatus Hydrogenedens sp.]|nr:DUF488 family protein [Candidatus Hydrogenedens sp.]
MTSNLIPPVYHRQRLLLFLIHQAGGRLGRMDLQKLLFLFIQEGGTTQYSFVPYRYGCFSFQANEDLDLLSSRGWLSMHGNEWVLNSDISRFQWVTDSAENQHVRNWLSRNRLRGRPLVREVYRRFPYYAINSEIKNELMTPTQLRSIPYALPAASTNIELYTIGYEAISFEAFANKLIRNRVAILCDVRRNPLSRKFGFSKSKLCSLLPRLGIEYVHFPELGIPSDERKNLHEDGARTALFGSYARQLPEQEDALEHVYRLLRKHKRLALTCFEQEAKDCHRHCISDYFSSRDRIKVVHL